jgi:hypothetical protein
MLCLLYKANITNTGALTVNVSGLGVKSIKTMAGADPTAGDIVAGYPMLLMYDGTNFVTLGGSEFLSKTGNQTLTGNLTLTGSETISGTLGVTGLTTLNAAIGLTRTAGDNTTNLATTAFVTTSTANEAAIRLAADNLRAPLASPALTGTPTSTTASAGTSTTQIATTAFVTTSTENEAAIRLAADNLRAPLASPALTGTPTSPTASAGTSTNQIATCAFVTATAFNAALPAQAGNAGKFVTTDGTNASWAELVIPSYLLMAQGII